MSLKASGFAPSTDSQRQASNERATVCAAGKYVACSAQKHVRVYRVPQNWAPATKPPSVLLRLRKPIQSIDIRATGDSCLIAIGFSTGEVLVHDPFTRRISREMNNLEQWGRGLPPLTAVRWIPDSLRVVVAFGPQLLVADVERQETTSVTFTDVQASFYVLRTNTSPNLNPCAIVRWKEKFGDIRNCAFSPTGDRLALAFSLGRLVVFDWRKNAFLFACRSHYGAFTSVAWSPDGQYLATGSEDDLVCVWASGDGQLMALADRHMAWVSSVTFDASHCDERAYTLASGSEDCTVAVWEFVPPLGRARSPAEEEREGRTSSDWRRLQMEKLQYQMDKVHFKEQKRRNPLDLSTVPRLRRIAAGPAHDRPVTAVTCVDGLLCSMAYNAKGRVWRPDADLRDSSPVPSPPQSPYVTPGQSPALTSYISHAALSQSPPLGQLHEAESLPVAPSRPVPTVPSQEQPTIHTSPSPLPSLGPTLEPEANPPDATTRVSSGGESVPELPNSTALELSTLPIGSPMIPSASAATLPMMEAAVSAPIVPEPASVLSADLAEWHLAGPGPEDQAAGRALASPEPPAEPSPTTAV